MLPDFNPGICVNSIETKGVTPGLNLGLTAKVITTFVTITLSIKECKEPLVAFVSDTMFCKRCEMECMVFQCTTNGLGAHSFQ